MSGAFPSASALRYVRPPVPLHFPESTGMPEGKLSFLLRAFLFELLRHELGAANSYGCDQVVYWVANDPRRRLAPDVFVKLGVPDSLFTVWKCWERGAPDLAVEVASESDTTWDARVADYDAMGVRELVRFDPEAPRGARLRAWDRTQGDFVERVVEGDFTPCVTLGLFWVVHPAEGLDPALRVARPDGALVPSRLEALQAHADERAARVQELELALLVRGG